MRPPRREEVSRVLKGARPWTRGAARTKQRGDAALTDGYGSACRRTRSARRPRSCPTQPGDARQGHRTTQASARTGRSIRTLLAIACSFRRRHRACPLLRGRAPSTVPAAGRATLAALSTRPSPVVAAACAARSARRGNVDPATRVVTLVRRSSARHARGPVDQPTPDLGDQRAITVGSPGIRASRSRASPPGPSPGPTGEPP